MIRTVVPTCGTSVRTTSSQVRLPTLPLAHDPEMEILSADETGEQFPLPTEREWSRSKNAVLASAG